MQHPEAGALAGIRVLDLATARGALAGRLLAELGAEVILIEPREGNDARQRGPFEPGRAGDREASLYFAMVALGKRSVVLDPFRREDAARIRELARGADVFIESFDPGSLAPCGLDRATLCAANPALVYASITPFGQDGPLAGMPASDLTIEAAGGLVGLQGDPDRPPIPIGFPQASFHAGAQAAADIAIALFERLGSGLGQHLDVSAQVAMVWTLLNATGFPPYTNGNPPGTAETRGQPLPGIAGIPALTRPFACKDGHVLFTTGLPVSGERTLFAVLRWARSAGELALEGDLEPFASWIRGVVEGRLDPAQVAAAQAAAVAFLARRSKRELQDFAVANGVLIAPIYTVKDLIEDPHLRARDYWRKVGDRLHMGPAVRLSRTPLCLERPAPRLGADQALLAAPPRTPGGKLASRSPADGALAGIKVADFAWVVVGPLISKALADHGADVVRVESETRLDLLRQFPPPLDGQPGINRTHMYANSNTSKRGIALNLATEPGRRLARKVADWADVIVESFTPGTMKKFGLDYDTLSQGRPELIMLSTCMRGQEGPEAGYTGYGNQGASLAGLFAITGWPDRGPVGPWGAYTDYVTPRYGVAALVGALYHRARTGLGQYLDISQVEAGMHFIEPLALDCALSGRVAGAVGHDSPYACPHGTYACADAHRFIAIAVESAEQWRALCTLAPLGALARDHDALPARIEKRREIEIQMRAWCRTEDAVSLAERLRAAGVPAYLVNWPTDLYADPQLLHRGHFQKLDHPEVGRQPVDGLVTRFSRTPGRLRCAAPTLGQHTFEFLQHDLGLGEDEIAECAAAGALS